MKSQLKSTVFGLRPPSKSAKRQDKRHIPYPNIFISLNCACTRLQTQEAAASGDLHTHTQGLCSSLHAVRHVTSPQRGSGSSGGRGRRSVGFDYAHVLPNPSRKPPNYTDARNQHAKGTIQPNWFMGWSGLTKDRVRCKFFF